MPRIEMTRTVRVALFGLRVYLIVLLGLIILSFVMTFYGPKKGAKPDETEEPPAEQGATSGLSIDFPVGWHLSGIVYGRIEA